MLTNEILCTLGLMMGVQVVSERLFDFGKQSDTIFPLQIASSLVAMVY